MLTINAISGRTITLGREGENLARQVVFDISEWRASYGDGTVSLIAQRHGDAEPYPCNITVDGDTITWPITAADTAHPDYGRCELRYTVGDVLVKSEMWRTFVADALGTPQPEPPEPQKAWVDKVLAAGQAAVDASVNSPKIGSNGNWWVWDFDAGAYADTGVAASGGDIVRIELADYGLYFGGADISVPRELIDILRDALDNRKAPYVHGATAEGMEGTVLLDTMYVMNRAIFATGVGVMVYNDVVQAWFALAADPETLTASAPWGILDGKEGPQGPVGPPGPEGPSGGPGADGKDGYSPTIDISRGEDATILTITDVNGEKTASIPDGKQGPAGADGAPGADGKDGAPGKDNLPNVETLAGAELEIELAYNVEHRATDALNSLTITGFGAPTEAGKAALYSIVFTASADGVTVTLPDTIVWAVAEPVFTAGCTYWLTFTELGDKYLCAWVEVESNG